MGLFDTIIVNPPFACSTCGTELEIQTKHFDPALLTYRVGSVLSGSPVLSGILPETLFCPECHRAGRDYDRQIFLVVWHTILAGVERTEADAESRLVSVDRADLIGWLDEAQRSGREARARFWSLYRDVQMWHEHLQRDSTEDEATADEGSARSASSWLARIHRLSDEIMDAEDPLAEILRQHKETSPEHEGMF